MNKRILDEKMFDTLAGFSEKPILKSITHGENEKSVKYIRQEIPTMIVLDSMAMLMPRKAMNKKARAILAEKIAKFDVITEISKDPILKGVMYYEPPKLKEFIRRNEFDPYTMGYSDINYNRNRRSYDIEYMMRRINRDYDKRCDSMLMYAASRYGTFGASSLMHDLKHIHHECKTMMDINDQQMLAENERRFIYGDPMRSIIDARAVIDFENRLKYEYDMSLMGIDLAKIGPSDMTVYTNLIVKAR